MENLKYQADPDSRQQLLLAFEQFNQLSQTLCSSVDGISQVADRLKADESDCSGEEMQRRLQQLDGLLNAIPGAVVVLDPQGKITEANDSARDLLGQAVNQQAWRDIVHSVFLRELDQGELQTQDGRQFSISTRPLGYAPGQVLLLSDVTQTRKLQRAAQQNLHLMTMGKMMASLAHQIRTPLASAMLYLSQTAEASLDLDTSRNFSQKALTGIRHIEKMINDMLVFAHGGQFVTTRFSVDELLRELQEQLQPQLQQREARLQIEHVHGNAELQGNKDALLGAMANLCMNALQACQRHPLIIISVAMTRYGLLSISVKDNGCGMSRETREHIFDPFYSTKTDGTGLGLAVVKSVIESHQGRVAVYSRPGRGCRFRIFLPCRQALKTQVSTNKIN